MGPFVNKHIYILTVDAWHSVILTGCGQNFLLLCHTSICCCICALKSVCLTLTVPCENRTLRRRMWRLLPFGMPSGYTGSMNGSWARVPNSLLAILTSSSRFGSKWPQLLLSSATSSVRRLDAFCSNFRWKPCLHMLGFTIESGSPGDNRPDQIGLE